MNGYLFDTNIAARCAGICQESYKLCSGSVWFAVNNNLTAPIVTLFERNNGFVLYFGVSKQTISKPPVKENVPLNDLYMQNRT